MGFLKLGGLLAALMLMAAVGFLWKANERKAAELGTLRASLAGAEATIAFNDRLAIYSQRQADALAAKYLSEVIDIIQFSIWWWLSIPKCVPNGDKDMLVSGQKSYLGPPIVAERPRGGGARG